MKTRFFVAAMLCITAATAHAQRLIGVVSDSGSTHAVPGAAVSIIDAQGKILARAVADEAGRYSVAVGASAAEVRIERIGYRPLTFPLAVEEVAAFTTRDITLVRIAAVVDTVRTTSTSVRWASPGLRGFEERRATRSAGYFMADSALRKEDGRSLADVVLNRLPGLNVMPGRSNQKFLVSARKRCSGPILLNSACKVPDCYVSIYLDGILQYSAVAAGRPPDDANAIRVENLAGVEFYSPGVAPPEYNATDSGCGTLLLWTRER